jgi:hypothetical protein
MKKFVLLIAFALLVAACGDEGDDAVASLADTTPTTLQAETAGVDSEELLLEFSQCMRDNGVPNFPDPTLDADGNIRPFGNGGGQGDLGVDRDTIQAAQEECIPIVEDLALNFFRANRGQIEDLLYEFASCMRDEGVDMPDPDFSEGPLAGGGPFGDIDREDPEFQEAAETCSDVFGAGGFRLPGEGRGPGGDDNG